MDILIAVLCTFPILTIFLFAISFIEITWVPVDENKSNLKEDKNLSDDINSNKVPPYLDSNTAYLTEENKELKKQKDNLESAYKKALYRQRIEYQHRINKLTNTTTTTIHITPEAINSKPNDTISTRTNDNVSKKYQPNNYLMTKTELIFLKQLESFFKTENLDMKIFTQVRLNSIIDVSDHNWADINKINRKSIDFVVTDNATCRIACCIELDDYTHNRPNRQERDAFVNSLFENVNIKLFRVKVKNNYSSDLNAIKRYIIEQQKLI